MAAINKMSPEKQIIQLHDDKGISYTSLANTIGVSPAHLHFILKGKNGNKRTLLKRHVIAINKKYKTKITLPGA